MNRILIVDDSESDRERVANVLQHIFAESTVDLAVCSRLEEARSYVTSGTPFDAIIANYDLPDGYGIELTENAFLIREDPSFALLIVNGNAHEDAALRAWQAGCHGYLNKSQLTAETLQIALLEALERVRLKKELREQLVALQRAKNDAERAHEAKRRFLESVGPEIQTPLKIMLEYATLLHEHRYLPNAMRSEALGAIKRNAELVSRLFESVSHLNDVAAGKVTIENELIKPEDLIEDVMSLYRQRAFSAGISLMLRKSKDVPSCIRSDPLRLKQVLISLLEYALKNTKKGGLTLYLNVLNHLSAHEIILEFNVLFTPDQIIEDEVLFDDPGVTVAHVIADKLGGGVTLKSSDSHFTCISTHIRTPVMRWAAQEEVLPEVPPSRPGAVASFWGDQTEVDIRGMKILVGEDSPETQFLIKKFLEIKGALVELAKTGLEVVGKALEREFDVLLMDIQLPEMDGFEATHELRRMGFQKPIIALTAVNLNEVRERCLLSGFDSYLTKPIHPKVLFAAIARQVNKNKSMPHSNSSVFPLKEQPQNQQTSVNT